VLRATVIKNPDVFAKVFNFSTIGLKDYASSKKRKLNASKLSHIFELAVIF
jgi:hypothetical protein